MMPAETVNTVSTTEHVRLLRGLERASSRFPHGESLRLWRDLAAGRIAHSEASRLSSVAPQLNYLAIDTTGLCDLTCRGMCYYHPGIDTRQPLASLEALERAIFDANSELTLQRLIFAGKEPLLNAARFFHLAEFAAGLPDRCFEIGLVTNGRNCVRHWDRLDTLVKAGGLSFLDVSLDSGVAAQHDQIRGAHGTFALAIDALERCARDWPNVRVGSSSVLRHDNTMGLCSLLHDTSKFNRHFFIAPLQPPPFTNTPPLRWGQIRDLITQFHRLLDFELRDRELEVTLSLLGLYLGEAEKDGLFHWHEIQVDALGQCFVERRIGKSRFQIQMQVLPECSRQVGRILYTGAYLPNTHFVQAPAPERFAVGFVQDTPLLQLYQRALDLDGALARMLDSRVTHTCRDRSCWSHCFGGLAAAEHSFVGGAPLENQPSLCLKTGKDYEVLQEALMMHEQDERERK